MRYEQRERPVDPPIFTEVIEVDRKKFYLDLKENSRGRFVKITEDVAGHRDTIIVPAEVLVEFMEALARIKDFEETMPEESGGQ